MNGEFEKIFLLLKYFPAKLYHAHARDLEFSNLGFLWFRRPTFAVSELHVAIWMAVPFRAMPLHSIKRCFACK